MEEVIRLHQERAGEGRSVENINFIVNESQWVRVSINISSVDKIFNARYSKSEIIRLSENPESFTDITVYPLAPPLFYNVQGMPIYTKEANRCL